MPERKIRVHYTGIDLDRFKPIDRRAAKARLEVKGPLLITAGALIPRKGHTLVLQALPRVEGAPLMIVGDGPARDKLARVARRLGVAERVRFLGHRPHEELPALLAAADAMVLRSSSQGLAHGWGAGPACRTPFVHRDPGR